MARSHSSEDSDSCPGVSSPSSRDEHLAIAGTIQPTDPVTDPESPNAAHQSSDESGSSDGVLVELPSNNDQDSRSLPGDPDTGILVNFDGSMQEHQERDDLFVDASDHISSGGRSPELGESAAMVEVGEASRRRRSREQDLERVQARLDASSAECLKYKEETEAFGREVVALRTELGNLIGQQFLENRHSEHDSISVVKDCSRFVVHLKSVLDERLNTDRSVLYVKDQEIEVLNAKILEYDVSQDVLITYLGSIRGACSQTVHEYINVIKSRILSSIPIMNATESVSSEEKFVDGISLIEKRTMLLVEKHNKLLLEVEQLGQFVEEMKPGSLATQEDELGLVFAVAREELIGSKKKEERIRELEEENRKMDEQIAGLNKLKEEADAEMSKIKAELEQSESRFLAAKEKLSIAVTKGKQLVQHRDSLKQSLSDKTAELDKCIHELQHKANALEAMEANNEELKQLLSVKTCELEKFSLELQNKSNILGISEAIVEDQKQLLQEKTSELEKCLLEMQQKSKDLEVAVVNAEELKQSLSEKNCDLEKCMLNLEETSGASATALATVRQLKQALAEKDVDLENSLLELQEKTVLATNTLAISKELDETRTFVRSLQELVSYRDKALRDIEDITHDTDFPQDILSLDIVDKVRWLVTKIRLSDEILQENRRAKNLLFSLGVPEDITSAELDSQVDWLVRSFVQFKDELSKLQIELTHSSTVHESEVSDALKEVDSLAESLLKEKEEKESLLVEHEHLKVNHEKLAKNLALVSSEKERFIEFLKVVTATNFDDQPSLDMDTLLEKSIIHLRQKMEISLNDGTKLESMQNLLHVTHVELSLFEKFAEDLSDELGTALEEVCALKSEKESMQKELERLEEKNSLIRDKLSMAVKKGKGLVQEREGFKLTLLEKNSEIEKLKEELQLQESKFFEYREQITSLTDKIEQSEHLLNESTGNLKKLVDSINGIAVHTDKIFEDPTEKVNWITGWIAETENAKACLEQELEKVKVDSSLNSNRLAEALQMMKSLEMELQNKDKLILDIYEEKNNIQVSKAKAEDELQKAREEFFMHAIKLADAHATMKSLEDKVSALDSENNKIVSKSNLEISALNAKLAECMEELAKTRGSSENQLAELLSELGKLHIFLKNEGLFPLMIKQFHNKADGLKHMWMLVQGINDDLAAKGPHIHLEMEEIPALSNLSPLPSFEDFINNEIFRSDAIFENAGEVTCKKIIGKIYEDARLLNDRFTSLSRYMDDHIKFTLQALQAAKDEFIRILHHSESLNLNIEKLEARNQAQALEISSLQTEAMRLHHSESLNLNIEKLEARNQAQALEISSLQTEAMRLLSACSDATQELQVKFSDLSRFDSELEDVHFGLDMRLQASFEGKVGKEDVSEFAQAADNLLLACRKVIVQSQNLAKINKDMSISVENLKLELSHAEMTVETTINERKLIQERVLKLEGDMDAFQNICNEMKDKLNDYQSKEDLIKDKEAELKRLEHSLTAGGTGAQDEIISKGQVEVLFDKVNKLIVLADSPHQSESQSQELYFSSPVDKLFFVVDRFSEFQQGFYSLTSEKKDLQLTLADRVCEIEILKNSAESIRVEHHDLELKKWELIEVTANLEKIMLKLTGKYSCEDLKPVTAMDLMRVLERQMIALSADLEKSELELHELGGKLQAKDIVVDELSAKVQYLEDSHGRIQQPDAKERTVFEPSTTMMRPEITEIEEAGSVGMSSKPPTASAHVRTTRKGSSEHLVLNIDSESEQLIASHETDDKGHVFKSLNTSGLIPKQGRLIADKVDGIWVSGGRILMSKPGARLGLIGYWIFLHLWLLGSIL